MTTLIILHVLDRLRVSILGWVWPNAPSVCAPSEMPCTSPALPQSNLLDVHWGFNIHTQPFFVKRLTKWPVSSGVRQKFLQFTQSWFLIPLCLYHQKYYNYYVPILSKFLTNPHYDFNLSMSPGNKEVKNMECTYWIKSLSSGWSSEAKGSCPLPVSELQ